ncbi:lipoprotein LpqH [Mycobacterium sp.]|uniref:lipoprotein LpqH n=1 Tax=Mycobacterium sp. TaxID=1785 RepID=UPI002BA3418E|nr:lipoprotein LpqH [Mycobacterium sp.]HKP41110.1 lipoprotein LpqH [Mycobacterium sp.]
MKTRHIAVAAAVLAAGVAGCSSQPPALGSTTAKVTIDGKDTGNPHNVVCSQTGWSWMIQTPGKDKGFTAVIDTGDKVTARSIDFRDMAGFTGTYWIDNIGNAEVTGNADGKYTITGSANGAFTDHPTHGVTATFRIEADC